MSMTPSEEALVQRCQILAEIESTVDSIQYEIKRTPDLSILSTGRFEATNILNHSNWEVKITAEKRH